MPKAPFTIAALCALLAASTAPADVIIELGGGWEATIFNEEDVSLVVDFVSIEDDILVLEKVADFRTIDPLSGQPDPLRIAFTQIAPDAMTVSRIAIADETIFNNTGLPFIGYSNILVGDDATWDPIASADFSIDPFTLTTYSAGDTVVTFSGGTVNPGEIWAPGTDAGALFINIDLLDENAAKFVLKEAPAVPGPGTLVLLAITQIFLAGRRRRA